MLFIIKMESSSSAKIRGTVGQAGIGSNAWNRQLLRSDNNMFAMLAKQDGAEDSVVSYYSDSDDNTDDMMELTEVQSRKGKRQRMSSSGNHSCKERSNDETFGNCSNVYPKMLNQIFNCLLSSAISKLLTHLIVNFMFQTMILC